jgi:hypothetical protein
MKTNPPLEIQSSINLSKNFLLSKCKFFFKKTVDSVFCINQYKCLSINSEQNAEQLFRQMKGGRR